MRTQLKQFMAALCLSLLSSAFCWGQAPLDEKTLAFQQREAITADFRVIEGTPIHQFANKVFRSLLATATVQAGRSVEYNLFLLDDASVNAFSAAGGQVFLTQGIASLVGEDYGVLAAVLGHELGHELLAHHFTAYQRKVEKEAFAHRYADTLRKKLLARALIPFARRLDEESLHNDNLRKEDFVI